MNQELTKVRHCIETDPECTKFLQVREELCPYGKLVLRGTRLMIPRELRKGVVAIAQEGHVGARATKLRLRTKVWWPGIDKDVEKYVQTCHGCQLVKRPEALESMIPSELPPGRWQDLATDLLGPMPTGDFLLVVMDYYTRFYQVEITTSTTAKKMIILLEKNICKIRQSSHSEDRQRSPVHITGFQGFHGRKWYLTNKMMPLWAQANGEV